MTAYYCLHNAISLFFESNTSVTRQQWDELAVSLAGERVNPVPIQGTFSYTVTAGTHESKLFQFRVQDSSLDMDLMSLAKAVRPPLVADCKYHGTLDNQDPSTYTRWTTSPGLLTLWRAISPMYSRQTLYCGSATLSKTLQSFFGQSWNTSRPLNPDDAAALLTECHSKFDLLARSLPSRFASNLGRVCQELPSLLSGALRFVLSHGDLREMNILIDPETGRITGIVDWAEASILPFGFPLWGLENILGYMGPKGWQYYDNPHELEDLFWQTFREANNVSDTDLQLIRAARMAGLFYRYGFIVEGKTVKGVVDQSDPSSIAVSRCILHNC
ncbi:hypothetical protein QBC33DRAFT_213367 [Phialemonium atrogriseum]|uniref:Aminoglycoside phosphotransferase domain-containing protein n=1 Tax=Phialemonium atrogriseum TaxID=1093897 RepID=A0AAJ0FHS5_9PEZI|nr:uncharacterized protein QBC33DRAFT_213367 [Phialemonium atrogriseum]KAK1763678.1 hypothetical protein QBC33DRAFT_213367 [Phialemonium atrogriseum]